MPAAWREAAAGQVGQRPWFPVFPVPLGCSQCPRMDADPTRGTLPLAAVRDGAFAGPAAPRCERSVKDSCFCLLGAGVHRGKTAVSQEGCC